MAQSNAELLIELLENKIRTKHIELMKEIKETKEKIIKANG